VALIGLFETFDATPEHLDCSCTGALTPVQPNCSFETATCTYFLASGPPAHPAIDDNSPHVRAKVCRAEAPYAVGASKGWDDPTQGYTSAAAPTADTDAILDLVTKHPEVQCNGNATAPPLIVVPGLTSSSISYQLDNSAPPAWAFWCNKTTSGEWEALWPVDTATTSDPKAFVCWAANIEVVFDSTTNTFGPLRSNEQTELVDFGSFSGVGGLDILLPWLTMTGWTPGKTLFAAPFDWRVPSGGQSEFFTKLKALVEQTSAANGGSKVILWAYSFGPQVCAYPAHLVLFLIHDFPVRVSAQTTASAFRRAPVDHTCILF
jgi:hypothetical protein